MFTCPAEVQGLFFTIIKGNGDNLHADDRKRILALNSTSGDEGLFDVGVILQITAKRNEEYYALFKRKYCEM